MTMCFLTGCAAKKEEADAENKGSVTPNTSTVPEESDESGESGIELPEGEYSFVCEIYAVSPLDAEAGLPVNVSVESGRIRVGDKVTLFKADGTQIETIVNKLETSGMDGRQERGEILRVFSTMIVYLADLEEEDVNTGDILFAVAKEGEESDFPKVDNIGATFVIEDSYTIDGAGIASGKMENGRMYVDDAVKLVKADGTEIEGSIVKLEMFREELHEIVAGDIVSIALSGISSSDMEHGDKLVVVSKPKEDNYTFVFDVENSFDLSEKGLVVVGKVEAGEAAVGDAVVLLKADGTQKETIIKALESASDGEVEKISEGDAAGVYLEDIQKEDISKGDKLVICAEE